MAIVLLYLKALWRQWRTLLMGGSLTALALIFGLATGKNIATGMGWILLGMTFIGASYGAWNEERQKVEKLEAEKVQAPTAGERKKQNLARLSEYLRVGKSLWSAFPSDESPSEQVDGWKRALLEWQKDTFENLNVVSPAAADKFLDATNMPTGAFYAKLHTFAQGEYRFLCRQLENLHHIVDHCDAYFA